MVGRTGAAGYGEHGWTFECRARPLPKPPEGWRMRASIFCAPPLGLRALPRAAHTEYRRRPSFRPTGYSERVAVSPSDRLVTRHGFGWDPQGLHPPCPPYQSPRLVTRLSQWCFITSTHGQNDTHDVTSTSVPTTSSCAIRRNASISTCAFTGPRFSHSSPARDASKCHPPNTPFSTYVYTGPRSSHSSSMRDCALCLEFPPFTNAQRLRVAP